MPSSFEALLVALLFVAPGLMYELGIEAQVGYWRRSLADRTLRFFVQSVFLHAVLLPLSLWVLPGAVTSTLGEVSSARWWLWPVALIYVLGPLWLGLFTGHHVRHRTRIGRWALGRDPAPRAWDNLFATANLAGYVRVKLAAGGPWVAGPYGQQGRIPSFASSYPNPPDLYLAEQVAVDPDTGEFLLDEREQPQRIPWGLWIPGESMALLEFYDAGTIEADEEGDDG